MRSEVEAREGRSEYGVAGEGAAHNEGRRALMDYTPIRSGIEMKCAARFCQVTFDDSSECIQLDIPDSWAILFCSLKHLYQWAREQSEDGFCSIGNLTERTTWIEPHEPRAQQGQGGR